MGSERQIGTGCHTTQELRSEVEALLSSGSDDCSSCTGMRTGIDVRTTPDGAVIACVHVEGALCASTAATLVRSVDDLLELGVEDVIIDLGSVLPCRSRPARSAEDPRASGPSSGCR